MITLGINAAFHDSAAALVVDGVVIAASEEERFSRIKHAKRPVPFSTWELPFNAIDDCLKQAGIRLADVDHVGYSYDPRRFFAGRAKVASISLPVEPAAQPAEGWESVWDPLFATYIMNAPGQLADGAPHHLQGRLGGARGNSHYRFHFIDHHLCHQASAFLASPYASCAVMTLDGRGEHATTSYGVYAGDTYRSLGEVVMPNSLGILYEKITHHLGFLHSSDEYKVMALAAMGQPRFVPRLREHIRILQHGRYEIAPMDLAALFGPQRTRGAALDQAHFDLAASLQVVLEESVLQLVTWLREASGQRRLAMAGGVALNCVMNAKLRDSHAFDEIWVQPAAGDAGTALGAALWTDARQRHEGGAAESLAAAQLTSVATSVPTSEATSLAPRHWQMDHAYLGPAYGDDEIEALLRWAKLSYRRLGDTNEVCETTARLLADDKVIGWYQGRMEFGPRALGARSILASPIHAEMQARINELKDREDFRPVAPAIPHDRLAEWFSPAKANGGATPFMLFVYDVHPAQALRIPAACHQDLTARVQTVTAESNPRFHGVLEAFGRRTGVPVLINTSFNVRGEPVVCTPKDAIDAFHSTPLDALVIGSFLLEKGR